MTKKIDDKTIAYVSTLASLELLPEEKESAKKDLSQMLDFVDCLSQLDTEGVSPMSNVFNEVNVFREDEVVNSDGSEATLHNAPEKKDRYFVVPKTIEP
ncbi:MAG: Asp-tRNA(Asn)/Glu-tRNA(Gln) amidotransferase subunit GatC [Lachnospiraceae bacterium]|nr:Asp-tRNA(Asn)/Glu-tRNA(Gln) amidotransferase subunit GatC [Lachnospiraceae bacterium]